MRGNLGRHQKPSIKELILMQDSHPVNVGASSGVAAVRAPRRERASWALYDFANTIFSMNVATLYFSVWLI